MNIEERRTDKISIIVPCYNEEACIEIVYAETAAAMEALTEKEQVSYEIIFVDDGSRDGTLKELPGAGGRAHARSCTSALPFLLTQLRQGGGDASRTAGSDRRLSGADGRRSAAPADTAAQNVPNPA